MEVRRCGYAFCCLSVCALGLMCCSFEEAARYLETYKSFEAKPPDMLMERVEKDYHSRVSDDRLVYCWLVMC